MAVAGDQHRVASFVRRNVDRVEVVARGVLAGLERQ
jgi:hypothetical protein